MRSDGYQSLRDEYSAYISAEQLYKICRISKRSAVYLLQHGIIPCLDSGKKTRRYRIKLEDVIAYLQKREKEGPMIPVGTVSSGCARARSKKLCFSDIAASDQKDMLLGYFSHLLAGYPDVMITDDLVALTGLTRNTIQRKLQKGYIKSLSTVPQYLISKSHFLEYITSPHFLKLKSDAKAFRKVIGGFESWTTAR